jgi:hypothetical protein
MTDLPSPGFTAADEAALQRALVNAAVNPVQEVRFSDGRQVKYRTLEEIRIALNTVRELRLVPTGDVLERCAFASFSRD